MKILIAPNSLKESLCAEEVAEYIEKGINLFLYSNPSFTIKYKTLPICDGGTGFATVLTKELNGRFIVVNAYDPRYRKIETLYGFIDNSRTAIIEVAKIAGLQLLELAERNPVNTSSYGVGELIRHAFLQDAKNIYIGCGDTAINDYGVGMLSALGVKFFDNDGQEMNKIIAKDITKIKNFDFSKSIVNDIKKNCKIIVSCNLTSMLKGALSTSKVYARQKGANDEDIELLDSCTDIIINMIKDYKSIDVSYIPGAGSAGGLGASLYAFLDGYLTYSFENIFNILNFKDALKWSDLVITSEGLFDANSSKGKAPVAVSLYAKIYNKKVGVIVGSIEENCFSKIHRSGIDWIEPLSSKEINTGYYIKEVKHLIEEATIRLLHKIMRGI